jgi:hypothetical protein
MAISQRLPRQGGLESFDLRRVVVSNIEEFCSGCDRFIERQYREIIRGQPTLEQLENHRGELKWALRTAKLLECVASDPDSASPSAVALLKAKIWQLERSWKMLYEPMPEEEAIQILREVFPDESRTGSAH